MSDEERENRSIIGAWKALNTSVLSIDQQRCAKVRNRNVSCLKCADACTSGCISVIDGALTIDASKCVGCGTCATVCPTCALEPLNPNDAELAEECLHAVSDKRVRIACSRVADALGDLADDSSYAPVVCLGRVEESLVCSLAADGVTDIELVCGRCEMCQQKHGEVTARLVMESANTLLAAWKSDARVSITRDVPAGMLADGVTRDEAQDAYEAYFKTECACPPAPLDSSSTAASSASADGADDAGGADDSDLPAIPKPALPDLPEIPTSALVLDKRLRANGLSHVMSDGTLPHFVPNRRERLLDALAELGEPDPAPISSRLWGVVVIDGTKCSSCRMCATFCPTGAIRKWGDDSEDGKFGVTHHPADCVKCRSCEDICAEGAIEIRDETLPKYLMEGAVHKYPMKTRPAELGTAQQILNTMRLKIPGNIYER